MKIQLTQKEIIAAIHLYLTGNMNLDMASKNLEVEFRMGRGNNGLAANLSIEDTGATKPVVATVIPGFTDTADTSLALVEEPTIDPVDAAVQADAEEEAPVIAPAPLTTTNLFGKPVAV